MRIAAFLLKRIPQLIVISLLAALATFYLSSIIPGDFFSTHLLDSSARTETVEQLRRQYGLDQPALVQYWHWLKNLVRLDLGNSLFYQRPVLPVVADALANTLCLGVPALIMGFGFGIFLGTVHAMNQRSLTGRILDIISAVILSLPSLLLGLTALLFAAHSGWFPIGGMTAPASQGSGFWNLATDRIHHLILPVACLTVPIFAYVERIQYAATRNSRNELYVRFARSRGLNRRRIFFQYILRPGLNPVISISGPMFGGILSGSLVLEVIFTWPGLGQTTYDALFNSDLFLLAGCILGSSLLLVAGNLFADCILIAMDPRVRSSAAKGLE